MTLNQTSQSITTGGDAGETVRIGNDPDGGWAP
jgi:hypothetical protein